MITALSYSDFNRGSKNDEDDDEADDSVDVGGADREGVDEEAADVANGLPRDSKTAYHNRTSRPEQQDMVSDKETKAKRGGRRTSAHDELRSGAVPRARREPRARMPLSHHAELSLHPPLILPGWDNQRPSPAMPGVSHHGHHDSPHGLQVAFSPVNWTTPVHTGLDLSSQFADQIMMTPPPMPNVMPQASYMDVSLAHGSQQSFTGVPHPSQFSRPPGYHPDLHDPRHPSLRAPTPYEAFMGQPMHSHEMHPQRPYFM